MDKFIIIRQVFYTDERGFSRACALQDYDITVFNKKMHAENYIKANFEGAKKIADNQWLTEYEVVNTKFKCITTIYKKRVYKEY